MYWSGPAVNACAAQAIQLHGSEMAFVNLKSDYSLTKSVRGQRIELARAPIRAIAVRKFFSFDLPIDCGHIFLLSDFALVPPLCQFLD
jgi:hypothetical protein